MENLYEYSNDIMFKYRCECGEETNNSDGNCDSCILARQIENDNII